MSVKRGIPDRRHGIMERTQKELTVRELMELVRRQEASGSEFILRIEPGKEEADAGTGAL